MSQMKEAVASASSPYDRSRRQAGVVAAARAQPGYPNRRRRTAGSMRSPSAVTSTRPRPSARAPARGWRDRAGWRSGSRRTAPAARRAAELAIGGRRDCALTAAARANRGAARADQGACVRRLASGDVQTAFEAPSDVERHAVRRALNRHVLIDDVVVPAVPATSRDPATAHRVRSGRGCRDP